MKKSLAAEEPTEKNLADEISTTIKDATLAGVLRPFPEITDISAYTEDETGRVYFNVRGNVQGALKKISENVPVGSRDVLEGIKACRSMIWVLKEGR
jgi:hypothetical protein